MTKKEWEIFVANAIAKSPNRRTEEEKMAIKKATDEARNDPPR